MCFSPCEENFIMNNDTVEERRDKNCKNDSPKLGISEILKYQTYEKNMVALYALKFSLDTEVKDVLMATNVDGFEDLNDLILRVEYHTERPMLYLIQFRHKENKNYCIRTCELATGKNGKFSLRRYKKSYNAIICKLGEEDCFFTENISVDDIRVCIVTNASLQNITTVSLESGNVTCHLTHNPDLIDTKPKNFITFRIEDPTTTIQHKYSTFFRYFRLYDRQVNSKEAKEEIRSLLKTRFGVQNSKVAGKFIKFSKAWFKQERVLTKKIIKSRLLELLTGITDETQLHKKYGTFENLTDVNDYNQKVKILKQIKISLQARSPVSLYDLTNRTFHETVPSLFLLKNINETINIGSKSLEKPANYINRRFYKILLDKRVLLETKENIFLFNLSSPPDLIGKINIVRDLDTINSLRYDSTDSNLAIIVSHDEVTKAVNYITKCINLKSFSIHHVREYDARYLEWQYSWSNPENLLKFIVHNDSVKEQDALQYFKSNLNVVSALPGMGKTTILNTLARSCKLDVLALRLDLNTHEEYLQDENSELRRNPLKYVLKKMLSGENRKFEERLFNHLKQENRLILFVDAFDEILPTHTDAALSTIEKLKDNQIPMWIFTRPMAKAFLQKRFNIIPIEMVPLANDDIKKYLVQTVGQEKKEDLTKFLTNNLRNLCNAPLYLYMLSTVIEDQRLNIRDLNVTDLCDNFIEMSYQKHLEKLNIERNTNAALDLLESYKSEYLKVHKIAALLVIFEKKYLIEKKIVNDENLKSINDINTGAKNYELVVSSVDEETPTFFHKIYAEYFAALQIYEYVQNEQFYVLYELLFKQEYQKVRVMFDRITAKALPFHLAVVEQDINKLEALCKDPSNPKIFETDYFGRTALHLAMNSFKSTGAQDKENCLPLKILNLLIQHFKDDETILKQRDRILDLNFYEHGNQLQNISLFHTAAFWGATDILECVTSINDVRKDINELEFGNAPVHYAARNGFAEVIKLLRRNGANVDEINDNRMTALHEAIFYENEECVELLIKEGADVNRKRECTLVPMLHAAQTGNLNLIKLLIDAGGRTDVINQDGMTVLHYASQYGHEDSVNCFITCGINVNKKDDLGKTPMHWAAENGHAKIIKLLKEKGGRIDNVDSNGLSLLHYASKCGFEDCVKYLISEGANVNQKAIDGKTPILLAIDNDHVNVIKLLKEWNSTVVEFNEDCLTVLHYAAIKGSKHCLAYFLDTGVDVDQKSRSARTPLHYAVKYVLGTSLSDKIEIITNLIESGADVNIKVDNCRTSVHFSAESGNEHILKLLIDRGGNIYETDSMGKTPLHYASRRGHTKCVECLLNEIPDLEKLAVYVNQKAKDGRTSIHYSAEKGYEQVLKLLIDKARNIYEIDSMGNTPLHYASLEGHTKCVAYLLNGLSKLEDLASYVNRKAGDGRTIVHFGAENGNEHVLKLLIDKGGSIYETDSMGRTPLHYASREGHTGCVDYLLNDISEVEKLALYVNQKEYYGRTSVHFSAERGYEDVLQRLIDKGGNIYETDSLGMTPMQYASQKGHMKCIECLLNGFSKLKNLRKYVNQKVKDGRTLVHFSAERGNEHVLTHLIDNGGNIYETDSTGKTPLHYASQEGHTKCVECLLNKISKVEQVILYVNQKTNSGKTSLHLSAENGNEHVLKLLIDKGGNIFATDSMEKTPLHYASQEGHSTCVECLLNGISELKKLTLYVNQKARNGRTLIHVSAERGNDQVLKLLINAGGNIYKTDSMGMTPLHYASQKGHLTCVECLLNGISELEEVVSYVNQKTNSGETSVHLSAENGNEHVLKLLIDKGGNIFATDSMEKTPLHYASQKGRSTCVECLLNGISELEEVVSYINQKTNSGETSLHLSAEDGNEHVLKLLIDKGGNIFATDSMGMTPIHYASQKGHSTCVECLLNGISELEEVVSYVNQKTNSGETSVHLSAENGNKHALELLIDKGGNIYSTDSMGMTPLHYASQKGHLTCVECLLNGISELEEVVSYVNQKTNSGETSVHVTAESGYGYVLKLLIKKGGNIYETDSMEMTPLHYASKWGNMQCVQCLVNEIPELGKLAEYVNQQAKYGGTPMHFAASNGHIDVIMLLEQKGGRIVEIDQFGVTALHLAVSHRNLLSCRPYMDYYSRKYEYTSSMRRQLDKKLHCARYLLKVSSDLGILNSYINQETIFGRTAMHFAASSGFVNAIELLTAYGGKIDVSDLVGITALHLAILHRNEDCFYYLIQAGADMNKKAIDGSTLIHFCAQRGCTKIIRYLKEKGRYVNEINSFGETCLHYASSKGRTECVQYLLEEGLEVNQNTCRAKIPLPDKLRNLLTENNNDVAEEENVLPYIKAALFKEKCAVDRTPMHYAAAAGHVEVMKLLAEKGGKLDNIDSEGLTPLHHAASNGNIECLEYLLDSDVDIRRTTKGGKTAVDCAAENGHVAAIHFLNSF